MVRRELLKNSLLTVGGGMAVAAPVLAQVTPAASAPGKRAEPEGVGDADWRETWAYLIGMQAYAYGFPAIYYTKLRFGMVKQPQGVVDTPLNTLFHVPRLSDHNDQYGGSPMRDAIYSIA